MTMTVLKAIKITINGLKLTSIKAQLLTIV